MEAGPERGALMLVRCVAVAGIGWTLVELALYLVTCRHNQTPAQILPCLFRALPLFAGVLMLIKARAIAEWVSNLLDN